jgi:hypothetical protein
MLTPSEGGDKRFEVMDCGGRKIKKGRERGEALRPL